MTTNIRISKKNRDKLSELKQKGEYHNLDEVITHLIVCFIEEETLNDGIYKEYLKYLTFGNLSRSDELLVRDFADELIKELYQKLVKE